MKPRPQSPCLIEGCDGDARNPSAAKGLCPAHYKREWRGKTRKESENTPLVPHTGHTQVVTNVSQLALQALDAHAQKHGLVRHSATREVLLLELGAHEDVGPPSKVVRPRGNNSHIVAASLLDEDYAKLKFLADYAGESVGWVAQQFLEGWARFQPERLAA